MRVAPLEQYDKSTLLLVVFWGTKGSQSHAEGKEFTVTLRTSGRAGEVLRRSAERGVNILAFQSYVEEARA